MRVPLLCRYFYFFNLGQAHASLHNVKLYLSSIIMNFTSVSSGGRNSTNVILVTIKLRTPVAIMVSMVRSEFRQWINCHCLSPNLKNKLKIKSGFMSHKKKLIIYYALYAPSSKYPRRVETLPYSSINRSCLKSCAFYYSITHRHAWTMNLWPYL